MPLDSLEKKVLLVMLAGSVLILGVSYAAYATGVGLGGTDAKVEDSAAGPAGVEPTTPVSLPPWGEPVLFFVIPSVLGLVVGYLLPSLTRRREEHV